VTQILVFLRDPERSVLRFDALARNRDVTVVTASSIDEARPFLPETEVLITLGVHLGEAAAGLFGSMPRLRWVQLIGTGTDNVADHLQGTDVALTNARGLHGRQMSEAAIGAMLALARRLPQTIRNQSARLWERAPGALLSGKTVGILGLGAIADALAPRCRALGMRVVGITGTPRALDGFDEVRPRRNIARALADLDHLILLAPYSAATHHLVDADALRGMKRGSFLINLARGGIVDEAALIEALDADRLAGAALDVFEQEPLPASSPLWAHPKVMVTPHVGGLHDGYADDVLALAADNLRQFLDSGTGALQNRVPLTEVLEYADR
jgi:D-2-hydroxyacid dehydrogenase (NADP+)